MCEEAPPCCKTRGVSYSSLRRFIIAVKQSREIGATGRPPALTADDCAELTAEETAQSTLTGKNKFHEKLAQKA